MHRVILTCLLVATLAGCADSAPAPTGDDGLGDLDAQTSATTGGIAGVVVTEAIEPVADVIVSLTGSDQTAVTDETGTFAFDLIEPGSYFVNFAAEGYFDVQSNAMVKAGEVAKLRVVVSPDLKPMPFHTTLPFNGYAEAWAGIAGWAYDITLGDATGIRACGTCEFDFTAPGNLSTIVMEATWEDTISPGPASAVQSGYYLALYQDGSLFDTWYVDPGEAVHVQASALEAGSDFTVSLYPDDVWPGMQQSYELWVTTFHYDAAPADWSFIAGSE